MEQIQIQKSFWRRPEGKTGMLMLPILVGALGLGLWVYALPFIVWALANTILALGMIAVLVFLFFVAINPNVHAAVEFLFKRSMYHLTDAIYKIDPIGVLRVAVLNMEQRVRDMTELKEQLQKHIRLLVATMRNNEAESNRSAARAGNESTNKYDKFVESRQADRLKNSNVDYQSALNQLKGIDSCLDTYIKVTTALAKDSTNEANTRERDRNNLLRSHRILKQAAKTLKGHEEAMNMFNHGVQIIVDERLTLLSEVDSFAQLITDTVGSIDINAGIIGTDSDSVNGWERSAAVLERKVDLLLLGPGTPDVLTNVTKASNKSGVTVPATKSYSDLFDNK